jgi:hypothetical protein
MLLANQTAITSATLTIKELNAYAVGEMSFAKGGKV